MSVRLLPQTEHRVFSTCETGLNIYEDVSSTGKMKFLLSFPFKTDTFFSKVDRLINSNKKRLFEIDGDQSFLVVRCDNVLYISLTSGRRVLCMKMYLHEWQLARVGLLRLPPAEDK